jgi:hypothetical protein
VPREAAGAEGAPRDARLVVIREFSGTKAVIELLNAGHPVLAVLRVPEAGRRRVLDLLTGWVLGSGGEMDMLGSNSALACPPGSEPVRLAASGMVSAVEEAFGEENSLTRDDEERLLPMAVAGSVDARRKLLDAYTEFATLFALRIRPRSLPEGAAVRAAQDELDRLVQYPSKGPLLASLAEGIARRILSKGRFSDA